jgi:GNAT superfamily N-acetyltransferase
MIIRRALAEDSHGIAVVHISSWQHAYRGIVPQTHLDQLSVADRAKRWVEIFVQGGSEMLVADALYVSPSHWSTGVGRSLWQAALARLRELGFVRAIVWVLAANANAIKFYERLGFTLYKGAETTVEIGGKTLPEVRYDIAIAGW